MTASTSTSEGQCAMNVALVVPGRTSSGGSAFSEQLAPAIERNLGTKVARVFAPPVGRIDLSEVADSTHVVFVGSRAQPVPGKRVVFWPLNVAPFERHVLHSEKSSLRNRARHIALLRRLGQSVAAADGLLFGSFHARTLYMARYTEGSSKPYSVVRGGVGSGLVPLKRQQVDGKRLVLVVSHLYSYKGILQLVEALGHVAARLPADVRFRVAGADRDKTYAATVHRRAAELGLGDRLVIAPAQPDELSRLYAEATLAVFTSTCENAGSFALYDGLHAGVPTLCSDRSSMPEMVRGAVRYSNPCQPETFGEAILNVLNDHGALATLSEAARKWSEDVPTWDNRASMLVDFLTKLRVT